MNHLTLQLAQAAGQTAGQGTTPSWVPLVVQIGLAITAVIVGTVVVMLVRRKFSQTQTQGDPSAGTGLMEQLRQMHREGKISDEELTAIRSKMRDSLRQQVGMATATVEKPADPAILAAKRAAIEEQFRQKTNIAGGHKPIARPTQGPILKPEPPASSKPQPQPPKLPPAAPRATPPAKPLRPDIS